MARCPDRCLRGAAARLPDRDAARRPRLARHDLQRRRHPRARAGDHYRPPGAPRLDRRLAQREGRKTATTETLAPVHEQTRARYPDSEGFVERDGVRVHYEVYGRGETTVFFLPTWSIIHSRHWKMQIPYFARHFRVLTFDGRGNGKSDRPEVVAAYA